MSTYKKTTLERIEFHVPDRAPAEVPLVVDDWTLAFRLGFTGKALWYFSKKRDRLYKVFKIKKASGGLRTIHNPDMRMRILHRQMRAKILLPLCEKLGKHVSAYQVGQSTKDAAAQHMKDCPVCVSHERHNCSISLHEDNRLSKGYALKRANVSSCLACQPTPKHDCPRRGVKVHLDLKNFFGSTKRAWIRKYFQEVVGYNFYVSSLLATLLTVEFKVPGGPLHGHHAWNGVPQGAPSSGDICNLVADWRLDQPLLRALEGTGWTYTRYADDLYFSHDRNLSRMEVDALLALVAAHTKNAGYRLNFKKQHVQRAHKRQQLLGIVLNQKLSIPRDQYRKLRSLIYNCAKNGFAEEAKRSKHLGPSQLIGWITGKLSYYKTIDPEKASRLQLVFDHALKREPGVMELDFGSGAA